MDISYNYFRELDSTISELIGLKKLKVLYLLGNPLCLVRNYSDIIISQLIGLTNLDGVQIVKEEEESMSREVNDINDLMSMLFAEDRLKQQALEAEKNKKGPQGKDKKLPEPKKDLTKQTIKGNAEPEKPNSKFWLI